MSEFKTERFFLTGENIAQNAIKRILDLVRCGCIGLVIEIKEMKRSNAQNAKMHAMLTDLSKQADIQGLKLGVVGWKQATMAAFARQVNLPVIFVPALDGQGFDPINERTSNLTTRLGADYIEYLYSVGAEKNVKWSKEVYDFEYLEHATRRTRKD